MALTVRNIMSSEVKTLTTEMSALDAAGLMARHDVGSIPVVSGDGSLVGIVTDRDLVVRVLGQRQDPASLKVTDVATSRDLATITPGADLPKAMALMAERKVKRLPVVQGDRLVGIVSMGDVANASASKRVVGEMVAEVFESDATTSLNEDAPDPGTPERVQSARDSV
jgi:CBS domain-containing protein